MKIKQEQNNIIHRFLELTQSWEDTSAWFVTYNKVLDCWPIDLLETQEGIKKLEQIADQIESGALL